MKQVYGYVRISSRDQNADRQIEALKNLGISESNIFIDICSGKNFNRSEYIRLKRGLHKGDKIVIKSLDRLGRNYNDIQKEWREITYDLKTNIKVLDFPLLDTTDRKEKYKDLTETFIADLVLQILSYVAEQERNMIKQRQAEGIAVAKTKGVKFGRPKVKRPSKFDVVYRQWANKSISTKEAMRILKLKETVFLKFARQQREMETTTE